MYPPLPQEFSNDVSLEINPVSILIRTIFRTKFNSPTQQVVFLAASDNQRGFRENLKNTKEKLGTVRDDLPSTWQDIFFTEDLFGGKLPGVGEDLALLSLCEHSIIGVGSRVSAFKQHSTVHAALWHSDVWLSYGPESRRWNL